jgi:serine/threonine-protein kinase
VGNVPYFGIKSNLKNHYNIIKELGEGGFGKTFLAEDTHLPSRPKCVIKQLIARLMS